MNTRRKGIPPTVIRRLTKYLAHIQEISREGIRWVSSGELADALDLTSSTVRQDLSHVDISGTSKMGYPTDGLEKVLANVLGADRGWNVVVVGAGNLGRALALHEEFARRGFNIRGVFDVDEKKIGRKIGALTVVGIRDMPKAIGDGRVDIGIVAVPASAAQGVADLLIASGVRGLLNLALTHIVAPKTVAVIESRIVASLLELSHAVMSLPARS